MVTPDTIETPHYPIEELIATQRNRAALVADMAAIIQRKGGGMLRAVEASNEILQLLEDRGLTFR